MKKGIKESNVQRMRNLVSGNYSSKTKISSGYTKTTKDYKEGDIWEENGKQWTIKRGIKRTVGLTCVTKWEHQMIKDGVYDEWHKQFDEANFNAYIDDIQQEFEQWLQTRESKQYITEAGKIEDWKGGKSKKELRETFKKELNKALESRYEQK